MNDESLVKLMSELARLLSGRSPFGRGRAIEIAQRRLRSFAHARGYSDAWCVAVLMTFLPENHATRRAA